MKYGQFVNQGETFRIETPDTPTRWMNPLFNDEYLLEVDQRLQGNSYYVEGYTRHALSREYRNFYLLDKVNGELIDVNQQSSLSDFDDYQCDHSTTSSNLIVKKNGVSISLRVFVPKSGKKEYWTITLSNNTNEFKDLSFFSAFGLYDHGVMGGECDYHPNSNAIVKYAFPYHTFYHEKDSAENKPSYLYLTSSETPSSVDMSQRRFFGGDNLNRLPQSVRNGKCNNVKGEAEDFVAAMEHSLKLLPGESQSIHLQFGIAKSKAEVDLESSLLNHELVERKYNDTIDFWKEEYSRFSVETPDNNINYLVNHWLKKQVILLCRQNRGTTYCPIRNQLQDAMGYAMINPSEAEKFMLDVIKEQREDGFIQQWHFTDGTPPTGLCLLNHTDGPLWLVICLVQLIKQQGSNALFYNEDFLISERLFNAIEFMYQNRGRHGLCLIGDGDWNDPINGVGREGKGESTWSTMALIYSINEYLSLIVDADDMKTRIVALESMRSELENSINEHCWDGQWYVAGFDDNGIAYGSKKDNDRLFLNAQTWAIISKVASLEKQKIIEKSLERLDTPFGPLLLDPAFDSWDDRWGRVSIKKSGTTENGSIYCHASMFKAFADSVKNDGDALYDVIAKTLPTNPENPIEQCLQVPLYISNYYYGLKDSPNFGRSSMHYGTGTSAWMLLVVIEGLFGVKASGNGLCVNPCFPKHWASASCIRKFRNSTYEFTFKRGEQSSIHVNGELINGIRLPYEEASHYQVEVVFT
ncbi:GH36-type glycosyl hydrolase domain-containing protein [Vibrio maritimus]